MQYVARTPAQLGDVLKGFRRSRKMTQEAAGQRVGLPQNVVSIIETRTDSVSVERLFTLLSALGLELVIRDREADSASTQEW